MPTVGVWQGGILIGNGRTYRIALYDWDGKLVRVLARDTTSSLPGSARVGKLVRQAASFRGPNGERPDPVQLAQDQDKARTTPMRFFSHLAPLQTDARGRIWVVGPDADSAYADVFTPTGFIGRLALGCGGFAGRWALKGEWLAMACDADEDDTVDAVVKLFRIVDAK